MPLPAISTGTIARSSTRSKGVGPAFDVAACILNLRFGILRSADLPIAGGLRSNRQIAPTEEHRVGLSRFLQSAALMR